MGDLINNSKEVIFNNCFVLTTKCVISLHTMYIHKT